jgi:putative membrane protein
MVMNRIVRLGLFVGLLLAAPELGVAGAQENETSREPRPASPALSPVDYDFMGQANLGAQFQIDSGRLAEKRAMTPAIREYAHEMVATHGPAKDALERLLVREGIQAPPEALLKGAYDAIMSSLEEAPDVTTFERDYMRSQVEYQKGNAALLQNEAQNGSDADLKEFARATLPNVEGHVQRASKIAADVKRRLLTH